MRLGLVGTVESTLRALHTLSENAYPPVVVVGLPPDRSQRHSDYVDLEPSADSVGAHYIAATDINDADLMSMLAQLDLDHILVIGWSQLCTRDFLSIPKSGVIGFHPAPLPMNRGRAVIPWTILQEQRRSGSTLFWLDEGTDTGDVLDQRAFDLDPDETATSLYAKHLDALQVMLSETLPKLANGEAPRRPQDHSRATYCAKRTPADGMISWQWHASDISRLIRATTRPYPGANTIYQGHQLDIWSAREEIRTDHWAQPGQIVELSDEGPLVACGHRTFIRLLDFSWATAPTSPLKLHQRLGLSEADLMELFTSHDN